MAQLSHGTRLEPEVRLGAPEPEAGPRPRQRTGRARPVTALPLDTGWRLPP
ncbi:hypothetical protein ACFYM0_12255 [Streptomyces sp. NPDC006487]|uniref:hypothetical protein n=1 Tax=Streptomyces sp. NPDC006487 TaxID=3364748 RepID=UPI0036B52D18